MKNLLWPYLRKHIHLIIAVFIMDFLAVICQMVLINETKPMLEETIQFHDDSVILIIGLIMLVNVLIFGCLRFASTVLSSRISADVAIDMRRDIYRNIMENNQPGRMNLKESDILTSFTSDVTGIQRYIVNILNEHAYIVMLTIGLVILVWSIDNRSGYILLTAFILMLVFSVFVGHRISKTYTDHQKSLSDINNLLMEKVKGSQTIRAYGTREVEIRRFDATSAVYGGRGRTLNVGTSHVIPVSNAIMYLSVLMICMAYFLSSQFYFDVDDVILLLQYSVYATSCVSLASFIYVVLPRIVMIRRRLFSVLDIERHPKIVFDDPIDTENEFEMESVSSRVSGLSPLNDMNMIIRKGSITAIVGKAGSGKSTVTSMLLGLIEPDSGTVRRANDDISYAYGSRPLFRGTIEQNLDPRSDVDEDRLVKVCCDLGVDKTVSSLKDGIYTEVEWDHHTVSKGQGQIIATAACLARKAPVYIFDGCFYSMDPQARKKAADCIKEMTAGSTVVLITNQEQLIECADMVYVMENGRAVDSGTLSSLREKDGPFRRMYTGWRGE